MIPVLISMKHSYMQYEVKKCIVCQDFCISVKIKEFVVTAEKNEIYTTISI